MANPAHPPAQGPAPSPARDSAASMNEVTALLLEVLRNVNREVEAKLEVDSRAATAHELEGNAQRAVVHFRQISVDLRTPADGSASFSTTRSGTAESTGTTGAAATPARLR